MSVMEQANSRCFDIASLCFYRLESPSPRHGYGGTGDRITFPLFDTPHHEESHDVRKDNALR